MAIYPFLVHLRRYKRVIWQLHRPISRQFEPIEPLTVAAEHSQGAPKIFNTPGVDLGRSTGANGDVQGREEVGLSPLTRVAISIATRVRELGLGLGSSNPSPNPNPSSLTLTLAP